MTDPDTLGPCEPGTAVKLEGVVHHVTDKGEQLREICFLSLQDTGMGKTELKQEAVFPQTS